MLLLLTYSIFNKAYLKIYSVEWQNNQSTMNSEDAESGHGLTDIVSRHVLGGTGESHENLREPVS
jgi:hypothetical protein